ncbi:MAG: lipid-A-disaccharide synthase [Bacteroidales bacterium]|nr:lipid-A-disaccharide synthase [Bacteroidales bacterium]
MKYYVIAGEASGDLHGSNLLKGLYEEDPAADVRFWGGPLMKAVYQAHQTGEGMVHDYKENAVMGFTQVILHAGKHLRRIRECQEDILRFAPDVVILIDYPGFNFRIAAFAHSMGIKVFWYIAPKVWASRENRIRKLKRDVDQLFIVFPFEKAYFDRKGVSYIYKGNPLVDAIDDDPALARSRAGFLQDAGLPDRPIIAILAGSRKGEVKTMMPVCSAWADRMHALPEYKDYQFVIAGAPSRSTADYAPWIQGREDWLKLAFGQTRAILRHAEAAVINSGTASLEACLIGTPQVVGYALSPVNYFLGRLIIKVKWISLGNLIAGRGVFRELIQHDLTPENLEAEVRRLIEDSAYREALLAGYKEIRQALGGSGASKAVAREMVSILSDRK